MELQQIMCTYCASNEVKVEGSSAKCNYCGTSFIVNDGEVLAKYYAELLKQGHSVDLANLRRLISSELSKTPYDYSVAKSYCVAIQKLLPEDFLSQFYLVYLDRGTAPRNYEEFLQKVDLSCVDKKSLAVATELIVKIGESKFKSDCESYIKRANIDTDQNIAALKASIAKNHENAERYAKLPRDVFVCYVSNDIKKAEEVHKMLLDQNISCFFAPYNLLQSSTKDYWESLHYAIKNCKIFLVVSSEYTEYNAAVSNDALKEMEFCERCEPYKERIEFRVGFSTLRTAWFRTFFGGHGSWIAAYDDFEKALEELANTIADKRKAFNKRCDEQESKASLNSEVEVLREFFKEQLLQTQQQSQTQPQKQENDQTAAIKAELDALKKQMAATQAAVLKPQEVQQPTASIVTKIKYDGENIVFGNYPQGASGEIEPIKWKVLEKTDKQMLLISEDILDCKPCNEELKDITWADCSLRKWLNNDFYNKAFTESEKAMIEAVTNTNNAGIKTQDKVWLLSVDEAQKYFRQDDAKQAKGTEYAKKQNLFVDDSNKNSLWWLRSRGLYGADTAAYVLSIGLVVPIGIHVEFSIIGVRLALKLNL